MKPHLDIEENDIVVVIRGKSMGRIGRVLQIDASPRLYHTLRYTMLDEATQEMFQVVGTNLKLVTEDYFTQHLL